MQTKFPDYVLKTLNILNAAGYEAYVVGGAVRDILLGTEPGDYDITTNARPEQIAMTLRAAGYTLAEKLGENFGVVAAVTEGHALEIATFRNERYVYGQDAHRPAEVWFCDTLQDDLSRRDFTVNAIAMDSSGRLYDYFGGQKDLKAKLLRTVGDPKKRFAEDALRMYRACRFVAQLDFTYVEGDDTAADVRGEYDPALSAEANLRSAMEKAGKTVPEDMKQMGPAAQLTGDAAGTGFGQPGTKYRLEKRYVFDTGQCRNLSLERVKTELDKMLVGQAAAVRIMWTCCRNWFICLLCRRRSVFTVIMSGSISSRRWTMAPGNLLCAGPCCCTMRPKACRGSGVRPRTVIPTITDTKRKVPKWRKQS